MVGNIVVLNQSNAGNNLEIDQIEIYQNKIFLLIRIFCLVCFIKRFLKNSPN